MTKDDFINRIKDLETPISRNGKSTYTRYVDKIGNQVIIDSELNENGLYVAVI